MAVPCRDVVRHDVPGNAEPATHNQELGLCLLEDYLRTQAAGRDRLLLACAKHTAGHRKYGDPLEAYRRFWERNFERLDVLLDELKAGKKQRRRAKP